MGLLDILMQNNPRYKFPLIGDVRREKYFDEIKLMMITDEKYVKHNIFVELVRYTEFYRMFSRSTFNLPSMGTTAICSMDTYVYSSIQGTIESIQSILEKGKINDAYALLRKYYDSTIINVYSNLYFKNNFDIENFIVEKTNNWLHGKDKLPEFRVMSNYIRSDENLTEINKLLYKDDTYKIIRDRCNDHTHYNYFNNVLLNDSEIYLKNRIEELDTFSKSIRDIFILHMAYIFSINDHYMMSSDYIDHLECHMTPEADSQYWVEKYIQDMFDEIISIHRKDIVKSIKQHSSMHLT